MPIDTAKELRAREKCFEDCSSGKHLDYEAGCCSICRSPSECQGWMAYLSEIERRPVLTPAVPQVLEMLAVATDDEADAILRAARRANIEVPE